MGAGRIPEHVVTEVVQEVLMVLDKVEDEEHLIEGIPHPAEVEVEAHRHPKL